MLLFMTRDLVLSQLIRKIGMEEIKIHDIVNTSHALTEKFTMYIFQRSVTSRIFGFNTT